MSNSGRTRRQLAGQSSWELVERLRQRSLWMPLKPHLIDQAGEFFHTSHHTFQCVGQLVAAGERVPYLDDKGFRFIGTSLSSDFQRRSTNLCRSTLASPSEVRPSVCIPTDGDLACHYSAWTKISLLLCRGARSSAAYRTERKSKRTYAASL